MEKHVNQTTEAHLRETALAFSFSPFPFPSRQAQIHSLKVFLGLVGLVLVAIEPALALPSPEDKPEEVLRAEIITGARSPIDGKPISASEYAQLQAALQEPGPSRPHVGRSLEKNLNLLRLRKFIKTFFPFLPVP